ncbi:MAG: integrase arm-type DNA-binding domain-containing protein [Pseudomonadota bacterium]
MRHTLKDSQCRAVEKPGRLADGDGLYLSVSKTGSKSWVFMFTRGGRRREMGLGSYGRGTAPVSLSLAREKADEARQILARGGDPLVDMKERAALRGGQTFGKLADEFIGTKSKEWKNDKHRSQWAMTLREYAKPLRPLPVSVIRTDDVFKCLEPIWTEKPETARRTRQRIEMVLDAAKARGMREGENPARLKGNLDFLLPKVSKLQRGHHAALPYDQVPALMNTLADVQGIAARALEFTILTAARTGEVISSKWSEFDLDASLWIVPALRTKSSREHRVPLSDSALAVLRHRREKALGEYVFHGRLWKKPLSNMAMSKVLQGLTEQHATVHGFRSSFRDWAGDRTTFARETIEECLSHVVGNQTELAYRRSDALEKRRVVMDSWAQFLTSDQGGEVVQSHE